MLDLHGPIRPAVSLAKELVKAQFDTSIVSVMMSPEVEEYLESCNIKPINLKKRPLIQDCLSFMWLELWLREALFKWNSRDYIPNGDIVVNFSHTFFTPSTIWYVQGPTYDCLRDMESELPTKYRLMYKAVKRFFGYIDESLLKRMSKESLLVVANSKFCASLYEKRGIYVHRIIYPPLDCDLFKPTTSSPSQNYVLVYFGKETKYSVLRRIADAGVEIKAFGSKIPYIPRYVLKHPNIEFLGRVSDKKLVDLYSNALYTLFTFTHEPFGYVPVESMACGTPVLTYNKQGPSETVVDGVTGWLADSDDELVELAVKLWKEGYPSWMRSRCRERALEYDVKVIADRWLRIIKQLTEESPVSTSPTLYQEP